jgi:hypothetical protein
MLNLHAHARYASMQAAERRRHKEAERWARKQMGAEAATDNANFAPVQVGRGTGQWQAVAPANQYHLGVTDFPPVVVTE